jgi:hypothetical protein
VCSAVTFINKESTVIQKLWKTFPHQTSQQSNILRTKQNITRGRDVPQLPSGVGSVVDLRLTRHAEVATGCSTCKHFIVVCANKMPTRCNTWVFIADLIACSTCFGHHYAHYQELESIIQVVAVVCQVCGLLQQPANRTHNPQLHTIPTTWKPSTKYDRQQPLV